MTPIQGLHAAVMGHLQLTGQARMSRDRMDFTSISDTVNLAARLEGANRIHVTRTLITETVHGRVKDVAVHASRDDAGRP
ncbi:MAG: hypothetical protein NT080_02060 [Spirochaetes bacterium]|nr:hypothetical protein [Spirochaetota bacterium]